MATVEEQSIHEAAYANLKIEEGSLSERPPLERGSCIILLEILSILGYTKGGTSAEQLDCS
jgi:hypothetical protein